MRVEQVWKIHRTSDPWPWCHFPIATHCTCCSHVPMLQQSDHAQKWIIAVTGILFCQCSSQCTSHLQAQQRTPLTAGHWLLNKAECHEAEEGDHSRVESSNCYLIFAKYYQHHQERHPALGYTRAWRNNTVPISLHGNLYNFSTVRRVQLLFSNNLSPCSQHHSLEFEIDFLDSGVFTIESQYLSPVHGTSTGTLMLFTDLVASVSIIKSLFSSVQFTMVSMHSGKSIHALHISQKFFFSFETVPVLASAMMAHSHPSKDRWMLSLCMPFPFRWLMVWCPWLCARW